MFAARLLGLQRVPSPPHRPAVNYLARLMLSWIILTSIALRADTTAIPLANPQERHLYTQVNETDLASANLLQEASRLLAEQPNSFVAHYVMGSLRFRNGRYPEAIRSFQTARRLAESCPGFDAPPNGEEPPWHAVILSSLANAYDKMERLPEAVSVWEETRRRGYVEKYSQRKDVNEPGSSEIAAFLKLGKVAQAKALAEERSNQRGLTGAEKAGRDFDRASVLFAEEPDGRRAYELFSETAKRVTATSEGFIPYDTLAFHALRQGHPAEAVQWLEESTRHPNPKSGRHPWRLLAEIRTASAQWDKARQSLCESWESLAAKRQDVRYELLADTRKTLAEFYLAVGYPDRSEQLLLPYIEHPIRAGMSSRPVEQWQAGVDLAALVSSRQLRSLELENVAGEGLAARLVTHLKQVLRRYDESMLERRIRALVAKQLIKGRSLRDVLEVVDAPVWLWGDIITVLGPREVDALRRQYPLQGVQASIFTAALQAEIAFADGRWTAVLQSGEEALKALPPEQATWALRIQVLLGEAGRQSGDLQATTRWWVEPLRSYRSVFRHLGIVLPVVAERTFRGSSQDNLQVLESSPRFAQDANAPWRLTGVRDGALALTRIADGNANPLVIVSVEMPIKRQAAGMLLRAFFASCGELKESDIDGLEGRALQGPRRR